MIKKEIEAYFSPHDLKIAQLDLDEVWVQKLVEQIKLGECLNHRLGSVYVKMVPRKGYYVVDGNHFVKASRIAGSKAVLATVFIFETVKPEKQLIKQNQTE